MAFKFSYELADTDEGKIKWQIMWTRIIRKQFQSSKQLRMHLLKAKEESTASADRWAVTRSNMHFPIVLKRQLGPHALSMWVADIRGECTRHGSPGVYDIRRNEFLPPGRREIISCGVGDLASVKRTIRNNKNCKEKDKATHLCHLMSRCLTCRHLRIVDI